LVVINQKIIGVMNTQRSDYIIFLAVTPNLSNCILSFFWGNSFGFFIAYYYFDLEFPPVFAWG